MSLAAVNIPKYATVLNGSIGKLGDGASTVGATALGIDGIAADAKVCYTAGAFGGMVESLMASTNDTVTVNVFVYGLDGATVHPFGIVNVSLSAGNLGLANPVPYKVLDNVGQCVDNYNHFTNSGFPSRGH